MKQKGFATIFGLCMVLVVALIVRGIQDSETNHAREVLNFEMEQALQNAAESGIFEAAEKVRINPNYLPYIEDEPTVKKKIPVTNKIFHHGEKNLTITVEVWGERGLIYFYNSKKSKIKTEQVGNYLMCHATIDDGFFGEKIYRRAYAYFLDDDTTINFLELPTQDGYIIKKKK